MKSLLMHLGALCGVAIGIASPSTTWGKSGARGDSDPWRGELAAIGVAAQRTVRDEDDVDSSGFGLDGDLAYIHDFGRSDLRLRASTTLFEYVDNDRGTRWKKEGSARFRHESSRDLRFFLQGEYSDNLVTVESSETDQIELQSGVEFSPGNHRISAFGGWREREYSGGDRSGDGPIAGARYAYRLGRDRSVIGDLRYEEINSDAPSRGYRRLSGEVRYTSTRGRKTNYEVGAIARRLKFDDRIVTEAGRRRRDWTVAPRLTVEHALNRHWFAEVRAEWIFRKSTDPEFRDDGSRVRARIGWRF
jgi:hypothetical protein